MINNEASNELGTPFLKNVEVKGKILENKKDKKLIIFKKREEDIIQDEKMDTDKVYRLSKLRRYCKWKEF